LRPRTLAILSQLSRAFLYFSLTISSLSLLNGVISFLLTGVAPGLLLERSLIGDLGTTYLSGE